MTKAGKAAHAVFYGPKGGKYADAGHTRSWHQGDWVGGHDEAKAGERKERARKAVRTWREANDGWQRARSDPAKRRQAYQRMYDALHEVGKALNLDPSPHGGEYARAAVAWLRSQGEKASLSAPKAREKTGAQQSLFKALSGGMAETDAEIGAWLWAREAVIVKAAGREGGAHKYIRRTGVPGNYRYYYSDVSTAHGAQEGERVNLRERGIHEVVEAKDGKVKLRHTQTGEERTVHAHELHAEIHAAWKEKAERGAERAVAAFLKRAGPVGDTSPGGLWKRYEKRFAEVGVDPAHAKALIGFVGTRKGWSGEAKLVLAEMAADPTWGKRIRGRERTIAAGAEALSRAEKSKKVEGKHVHRAAAVPTGPALDELRSGVVALTARLEATLEAVGQGGKALHAWARQVASSQDVAKLEEAVAAFPALSTVPEWQKLQALKARAAALGDAPDDGGKGKRGADTVVFVADESGNPTAQTARYRLVEASEVTASHDPNRAFAQNPAYPEGVQERQYHRDKEHQGVVRENARKLRPELVINTNPDAANGPPLMTRDGIVLGGNSRAMALQLAHGEGGEASKRYVEHLKANAGTFGLTAADVEGMKAPVLVREVDTPGADKKGLGLLVRRYNEVFTQGMDPRVDQVARARLVTPDMLSTLATAMNDKNREGEDRYPTLKAYLGTGRSKDLVRSMESAGIIDRRNRAVYLRDDGTLNEDGKTFVERLLVGRIVPEPDLLSEMKPSQVEALARAVPHVVRAGGVGHNIEAPLRDAIRASVYMDRSGLTTVSDFERDQTLGDFAGGAGFGSKPELDDTAKGVLKILREKPGTVQMSDAFREFAKHAERNPAGQADLLGQSRSTAELLALVKGRGIASLFKATIAADMEEDDLPWFELPEDHGCRLWEALGLEKGASHKYIKRVPKPGGGYRYYYQVQHGGGVAHEDHFVAGAAFKVEGGHYHITAADGDTLTVRHDETGKTERVTRAALTSRLREHHAKAIEAHRKHRELPAKVRRLAPEARQSWHQEQDTIKEATKRRYAAEYRSYYHDGAAVPNRPKELTIEETDAIEWKVRAENPNKKAPDPAAPVHLSWGWNQDAIRQREHPAEPGDMREHNGQVVVVTKTHSQYVREDGMSFGLGDDRGWYHTATARSATEAEAEHFRAEKAKRTAPHTSLKDAQKRLNEAALALLHLPGTDTGRGYAPGEAVASSHRPVGADRDRYGLTPELTVTQDAENYYVHQYIYDFDQNANAIPKSPEADRAVADFKEALAATAVAHATRATAPSGPIRAPGFVAASAESAQPPTVKPKPLSQMRTDDEGTVGTDRIAKRGLRLGAEVKTHARMPEPHHVVSGNTYAHKDAIRSAGARWDPDIKGWRLPKSKVDTLHRLLKGTTGDLLLASVTPEIIDRFGGERSDTGYRWPSAEHARQAAEHHLNAYRRLSKPLTVKDEEGADGQLPIRSDGRTGIVFPGAAEHLEIGQAALRWWKENRKMSNGELLKACCPVGEPGWCAVDATTGERLWAQQSAELEKAANHKYVRRTGTPGHYQYHYHAAQGRGGIASEFHMREGARFEYTLDGKRGHYEITGADGDRITVKHDETGHEATLTREQFAGMLRSHHAKAVEEHVAKLRAKLQGAKHAVTRGSIGAKIRALGHAVAPPIDAAIGATPGARAPDPKDVTRALREAGFDGKHIWPPRPQGDSDFHDPMLDRLSYVLSVDKRRRLDISPGSAWRMNRARSEGGAKLDLLVQWRPPGAADGVWESWGVLRLQWKNATGGHYIDDPVTARATLSTDPADIDRLASEESTGSVHAATPAVRGKGTDAVAKVGPPSASAPASKSVRKYVYGATLRPVASGGATPEGEGRVFGTHPDFRHGTVTYDAPLSKYDREHFDLRLIPEGDDIAREARRIADEASYPAEMLEEHAEDSKTGRQTWVEADVARQMNETGLHATVKEAMPHFLTRLRERATVASPPLSAVGSHAQMVTRESGAGDMDWARALPRDPADRPAPASARPARPKSTSGTETVTVVTPTHERKIGGVRVVHTRPGHRVAMESMGAALRAAVAPTDAASAPALTEAPPGHTRRIDATADEIAAKRREMSGVRGIDWGRAAQQGEEKIAKLSTEIAAADASARASNAAMDAAQRRPGSAFDAGGEHHRAAVEHGRRADALARERIGEHAFLEVAREKVGQAAGRKPKPAQTFGDALRAAVAPAEASPTLRERATNMAEKLGPEALAVLHRVAAAGGKPTKIAPVDAAHARALDETHGLLTHAGGGGEYVASAQGKLVVEHGPKPHAASVALLARRLHGETRYYAEAAGKTSGTAHVRIDRSGTVGIVQHKGIDTVAVKIPADATMADAEALARRTHDKAMNQHAATDAARADDTKRLRQAIKDQRLPESWTPAAKFTSKGATRMSIGDLVKAACAP